MPDIIYIEYDFKVEPIQYAVDILIAELGEVGFESFKENDEGVLAYIQKKDWEDGILNNIQILENENFEISYHLKEIPQENWNTTWEQNFNPINVSDQCVVRAPFHEKQKTTFDIVIEPKMSFGTGHHETTHMMLQYILEHYFKGKSVLDMGSGTGVLAILTAMKGAAIIDAIDIDHWCYLNAKENIERNNCGHINVLEGDASLLVDSKKYDIVIANINRNILLADIPKYAKCLHENGILFMSGFYESDITLISEKCLTVGLVFQESHRKNEWVAIKYRFS